MVNGTVSFGGFKGPGDLLAQIEDSREIGLAEYANTSGERYFVLPWDHWAHDYISALKTHVEVQRRNDVGAWVTLGWGLVVDNDSTPWETIYYVDDYLARFQFSDSSKDQEYANVTLAGTDTSILNSEVIDALSVPAVNNILNFISIGHIDTDTATADLQYPYTPHLQTMQAVMQISQAGTSDRPVMAVSRDTPFELTYYKNAGSDKSIDLHYGGIISDFRALGGWGNLYTAVKAVGQVGTEVLYSDQTSSLADTYGHIEKAIIFANVKDQAALDALALNEINPDAVLDRDVAIVVLSNELAPYDGYEMADSIQVTIKRGKVDIDHAWYTIWGHEWIATPGNGAEQLSLILLPKAT
jgi:hypothetical protein